MYKSREDGIVNTYVQQLSPNFNSYLLVASLVSSLFPIYSFSSDHLIDIPSLCISKMKT